MVKQTCILLLLLLTIRSSYSQQNLVPKAYEPIKEITGDLDKDSIPEKVIVYNMAADSDTANDYTGVAREIIIFKKDKDKWTIWHRSTKAIGNSSDGGMMGDPFEDIEIKNGILIISESGGSSWKWGYQDKYRYQNNRFELIGYTSEYGRDCEYWTKVDFNIMTGKIVVTKEYEKCDDEEQQNKPYKKENENFTYKLTQKITLENRKENEVKIISPKYKHELYL